MEREYLAGEIKEFIKVIPTAKGLIMEHHFPNGMDSRVGATAEEINLLIDEMGARHKDGKG